MPKTKPTSDVLKYCPQCGQKTSNSKFCSNCGYHLSENEKSENTRPLSKSKTHPAVWVLIAIVIGFVAIGVISILASIVIVAINPTKQLGDARNLQRSADLNTIVNAIYQYAVDNNGNLPTTLPKTTQEICRSDATDCTGLINLDKLLGSYLVAMPSDPMTHDPRSTKYTIVYDTLGHVTLNAPNAEQGVVISVSR